MKPDHLRQSSRRSITKVTLHGLSHIGPQFLQAIALRENIMAQRGSRISAIRFILAHFKDDFSCHGCTLHGQVPFCKLRLLRSEFCGKFRILLGVIVVAVKAEYFTRSLGDPNARMASVSDDDAARQVPLGDSKNVKWATRPHPQPSNHRPYNQTTITATASSKATAHNIIGVRPLSRSAVGASNALRPSDRHALKRSNSASNNSPAPPIHSGLPIRPTLSDACLKSLAPISIKATQSQQIQRCA